MAQGALKKKAATNPNKKSARPKQTKVKKGSRTIAPKQTTLVKQRSLQKKLTATINRNIEKQMSVKANAVGKLTIMKKLAEDTASEQTPKKKK
ncbi:hypothetical protein DM01DRAFT_1407329 [Hesseltinella vesiculosa]|uniref:Uncharacterized protein n=1 Tax=Hesseltinella vesiculosa TaxID=101127 RepID=A0A1X2GIE4_9FUNG|nr:hypothetical protein DM01DRAFT_1407329 [Hesseltinella vesiculosa]